MEGQQIEVYCPVRANDLLSACYAAKQPQPFSSAPRLPRFLWFADDHELTLYGWLGKKRKAVAVERLSAIVSSALRDTVSGLELELGTSRL